MPIDIDAVRNWPFPVMRQTYGEKDTILYAISLGYGSDPTSEAELRFVYERDLRALPTMAAVLGHPGFWLSDPRTGIDAARAVHGEQRMRFHALLGVSGVVRSQARVVDVIDKGSGTGALVVVERTLHDDPSGRLLATIEQRTLCRGDGGFSGPSAPESSRAPAQRAAPAVVSRAPTSPPGSAPPGNARRIAIRSLPQAALIYRLSADPNPLHADPAVARAAGFDRPILHGMTTFGIAARAIMMDRCGNDPVRLLALSARFSAPAYPGEMVCTDIWDDGASLRFRCTALERDVVILTNGVAEIVGTPA